LEVYIKVGGTSAPNSVDVDTANVTLLRVSRASDLSRYPRIVELYLDGKTMQDKGVKAATEYLRNNPDQCPDLAVIVSDARFGKIRLKEVNDARGSLTGRTIHLVHMERWKQEGRVELLRGFDSVRFLNTYGGHFS
jgi:hypothetical protein